MQPKCIHLKLYSLKKDAYQFIYNFSESEDKTSFIAWENLKCRYKYKRVVLNKNFNDKFKLKPLPVLIKSAIRP